MLSQADIELVSGTALRIAAMATGSLRVESGLAHSIQNDFELVAKAAKELAHYPHRANALSLKQRVHEVADQVNLHKLGPANFASSNHTVSTDTLIQSLQRMTGDLLHVVDRVPPEDSQLPNQELAPYHFAVSDEGLDLFDQTSAVAPSEEPNVSFARAHLIETAIRLGATLTNSPQVREELLIVGEKLEDPDNVVATGIAAGAFARILAASSAELGITHLGQLESFAESVGDFVAQFPDWQRYAANAAQARLTDTQISQAAAKLGEIAGNLRQRPELATYGAQQAINQIAKLGKHSNDARTRLAIWTTLKNLTISIIRTVTGEGGKLVSGVVAGGLALLALSAFKDVPLLASQSWAPAAIEYLTKAFGG